MVNFVERISDSLAEIEQKPRFTFPFAPIHQVFGPKGVYAGRCFKSRALSPPRTNVASRTGLMVD